MTPYYTDDWLTVYAGDCREVMAGLPAVSVDCVVTSPPYWSLRDYGIEASVWGGDPDHPHDWTAQTKSSGCVYLGKSRWQHQHNGRNEEQPGERRQRPAFRIDGHPEVPAGSSCVCGAWYGALGLEPTPDLYVAHLVEVMAAVWRVLKPSGTLWLNLGDTYALRAQGQGEMRGSSDNGTGRASRPRPRSRITGGLKTKDLVGVPWMAAFALRDAGWYLRQEIIWAKNNPMPESAGDRPTRAHEQLFLLSRSPRYFYDAAAISEPISPNTHARISQKVAEQVGSARANGGSRPDRPMKAVIQAPKTIANPDARDRIKQNSSFADATALLVTRRHKRSVWTVGTQPYPEAHFATFPPALVEPCILAGAPSGGVVLDPFAGTGTVGMVAAAHSRRAVLIDLNPDYLAQALRRNAQMPLGLGAEMAP